MASSENAADSSLTRVSFPASDSKLTADCSMTCDVICACRNGYLKAITFAGPPETQATGLCRCDLPATFIRLEPRSRNRLLVASTNNAKDKPSSTARIHIADINNKSIKLLTSEPIAGQTVGFAFGDDDRVFACQSRGDVYSLPLSDNEKTNSSKNSVEPLFNVGANVEIMDQYRSAAAADDEEAVSKFIATGGEENDVAVYDLNRTDAGPIFRAKNIPPNWVQLREPVWVRKLHVMDRECQKILCGTNYHQIRLYDRRVAAGVDAEAVVSGKDALCRPVINFDWHNVPVTALSVNPVNDQQIFAGNSLGKLEMLDLRMKRVVYAYKGVGGTVNALQCHPTQGVLVAASLDRFVRLYDVLSRKLLKEVYVKSEVNDAVLINTNTIAFNTEDDNKTSGENKISRNKRQLENDEDMTWSKINKK